MINGSDIRVIYYYTGPEKKAKRLELISGRNGVVFIICLFKKTLKNKSSHVGLAGPPEGWVYNKYVYIE